jgi:hypothetical protein
MGGAGRFEQGRTLFSWLRNVRTPYGVNCFFVFFLSFFPNESVSSNVIQWGCRKLNKKKKELNDVMLAKNKKKMAGKKNERVDVSYFRA